MATENAAATRSNKPKPGKKYFTLAEANRSLTYVSRVVKDLTQCHAQVTELKNRLEQAEPKSGKERLEAEYAAAMEKLGRFVDELQLAGVGVKAFDAGLVDFPAVEDGREICLCWKQGETSIKTWHEVDAGYAGRQPVSELKSV